MPLSSRSNQSDTARANGCGARQVEGFQADGISFGQRNSVSRLVNYVSREIGEPGKRTGTQDTRSALQSLKSRSQ
jgi:hypothetical protein